MDYALGKKLRTCSSKERKDVAMELAHTGTDYAVEELIRMVEGKRRHWLKWYSYGDVVLGIEALGETKNRGALDYLSSVIKPEFKTYTEVLPSTHAKDSVHPEIDFERITTHETVYPKIRGKLKKMQLEAFPRIRNAIAKLESTVEE